MSFNQKSYLDGDGVSTLWNKIKTDFVDMSMLQVAVNAIDDIKADKASPVLTGVPEAPTAAFGTNNNQIATTAFVQQALHASVRVSIVPAIAGIVVTLTSADGRSTASAVSGMDGVAIISLDSFGTYNLSFSQGNIKGPESIEVTAAAMYSVKAVVNQKVVYTVRIDESNSDPKGSVVYLDDAAGMTKGSDQWDTMPIFNGIFPCMLKNGNINYYLNPNNFNYKEDGSAADLTGDDGDVMIEFNKFAYKIYRDGQYLYVSATNDEDKVAEDTAYKYYAFSRDTEGDIDKFYIGAYKGWVDEENKLRSLPGKVPANSKTIGAFRNCAQANGEHYQQSGFFQLIARQVLYLIKYGTLNGQSALGNGVVSAAAAINTGGTETLGMNYGTTANSTTHVKLFGIEDFWGNIWEWVDGLTTDSAWNIITSWDSYSNEHSPSISSYTLFSGLTANASGYVKKVAGTTEHGFMGVQFNGSSTTYYSDYGYLSAGLVLIFGGRWSNGATAGPFYLTANNSASIAYAYIGARLSYV